MGEKSWILQPGALVFESEEGTLQIAISQSRGELLINALTGKVGTGTTMFETNPLGFHSIAGWPRHLLSHEKQNLHILLIRPTQSLAELL